MRSSSRPTQRMSLTLISIVFVAELIKKQPTDIICGLRFLSFLPPAPLVFLFFFFPEGFWRDVIHSGFIAAASGRAAAPASSSSSLSSSPRRSVLLRAGLLLNCKPQGCLNPFPPAQLPKSRALQGKSGTLEPRGLFGKDARSPGSGHLVSHRAPSQT